MKEQTKIPISKIKRTGKFVAASVKVGGNYLKHYAKKATGQESSQDDLDEANATDIYGMLSELKGGALKAAQMLSMDQGILPKAFAEKFKSAQYSAPPLSYPLVVNTFQKQLGKRPTEVFDTFTRSAINAASIGQVHQATLGDKKLAVKVQYPGVADSMSNDLKIAAPLAATLMKVKMKDLEPYMEEVESRLMEETDYILELRRSIEIGELCKDLDNVVFPNYYKEYSSSRIITMDWIDGMHLNEWLLTNPNQASKNKIGQAIWDFYQFQVHALKQVHADPHPGNFIVTKDDQLAIIDFGCVKEIPKDFYNQYFQAIEPENIRNPENLLPLFDELNFLLESDTEDQRQFFINILSNAISLLGKPFLSDTFDFGNQVYFDEINTMMMGLAKNDELRKIGGARGPQHAIYINRVYFGMYTILGELKAEVTTN
jgi:predicted unusual protein kinase regulating ubiquinone biosynthesis (AarF/ABC1/UbiB family)